MGYTHYWHQFSTVEPATWEAFADDVRRIIARAGAPVSFESDSKAAPLIDQETVRFNGVGDDGHETFYLSREPAPLAEYETPGEGKFSFCKTARKPYDTIVTAVLAVLAHHASNAFTISSDGEPEEWQPGLGLATGATNRKAVLPLGVSGA